MPLIFSVDTLKKLDRTVSSLPTSQKNKYLEEFTCPSTNSVWTFIKSVNDDVLGKIQIIVKENPGCRQLVKCELAYHVPKKLKK